MDSNEIKAHWETWAKQYREDLRATTKTSTIKRLEINALYRAINERTSLECPSVLEVGCGNGHNLFALKELMPNAIFTGIDYVAEMIDTAKSTRALNHEYSAIQFFAGDVLTLDDHEHLGPSYDIVFTVRCLINLNSDELQYRGLEQLTHRVRPGGLLLLLENQIDNHARQNDLREAVGLPRRSPATFNRFMDTNNLVRKAECLALDFLGMDHFASLHDIVLYVLVPLVHEDHLDYNHPWVEAATQLSLASCNRYKCAFGEFGQNPLLIFRKRQ